MTLRALHTLLIAVLAIAPIAAVGAPPLALDETQGMSAEAIEISRPILGFKHERTPSEQKLDSHLLFASRTRSLAKSLGDAVPSTPPFVQAFIDKYVAAADDTLFVVIKTQATSDLANALAEMGARDISEFPRFETVTAVVPLGAVLAIADRDDVRSIGPQEGWMTSRRRETLEERASLKQQLSALSPKAGTVTWQGVTAHEANKAHNTGISGVGAKVCVLSDGTNSVPSRIASGDLPASLLALSGQQGSGDEGTAMLEIIYDMAPGASLFFATGSAGAAQFATNILNLQSVFGCHVMVDDIVYLNEGAFQDGAIAQAVNAVTANGVVYLSSAANYGNLSDGTSSTFEGDFVASAAPLPPPLAALYGTAPVVLHSFGGAPYTVITSASAPVPAVTLKWSDPLGGSSNDYDLFVLDSTGTTILGGSVSTQNGTQDPFEQASCSSCSFPVGARIYIVKYSGSPRALRLQSYDGVIFNGTTGSTVGHNAAASALTVAAVNLATAAGGAFVGGVTNPVESFSSDGPRKMFYNSNGTPITPGNVLFSTGGGVTLNKVDLAAGDGGVTTGPGGSYNPFFGTSAAAPTAAAIAALVKSAKPSATKAEMTSALFNSALDIEAPGVDRDSGVGIVMAPASVRAVLSPMTVTKSFVPSVIPPGGTSVLTIAVTNSNSVQLQNAAFTDLYPFPIVNAAIPNATISGTGCAASGSFVAGSNNLTISTSTIPAMTTCTFRVTVTSPTAGDYLDSSGSLSTPIALNTPAASALLNVGVPPGAPTSISAVAGGGQVTVSFLPPASTGGLPILSYTASCSPTGGGSPTLATSGNSPVVVSGLIPGTSYTCTVTAANAAGNGPASLASGSVTPAKVNQTISFTSVAPTSANVGGPAYLPTAIATSGLPVTFTIAQVANTVCAITGATVTFTSAGTCVINANQAGNAIFNAAPQVQQSFAVGSNLILLTVNRFGTGSGVVTSTPAGINCGSACASSFSGGSSITLTATPIPGSVFTGWTGGGCSGTGACTFTLSVTTSVSAVFVPATSVPRLANIATRMQVLTGADVLIGGFIIGGSQAKTVVVRARGPSLTAAGVPGALQNPLLQLFSGQTVIAANDDWQQATNAAALQSSGFAPADPRESAILTTLGPGAYTAIVSGVGNTTGVGIVEVFEVDKPEVPLINIATRGQVLTNADVMIGGFIIQGDAPQTVIVRARGPSLTAAGVPGALQDPVLQLYSGQTVIASNDDWQTASNAAQIQSAGFAPSDSREAAILITLNPGAYTAIVTGKNFTTGVGIVEVFAQ